MPPVARISHADALDPMNVLTARGAVQDELAQFSLQIGHHFQKFQPDLFGSDRDGAIRGQPCFHRFIDDGVGLGGLLRHSVNGSLLSLVALIDVLIVREMWSEAKAALADAFKVCDRKRAPGLAAYAASREPFLRRRSSSP
jgi:hypothetical protein